MANHQSALKRIRQNSVKRIANRYFKKTTRTAIKKLKEMSAKADAQKYLSRVISMIDKLAKKNTWHKNKASNIKSSLMRHIAGLN
ncbi:MAG: 30S ribosomal protein S20 [Saprospiraceae bacterium]|nr:30S ribosomal protein S20 [Saprospiraceae bacterium]MBK8450588.1 30S ribosomal protein S20 [Saprospiraceae bacterium]MBK8485333.1 30S ribosomal protein S20 [Saprospiraceae bacterium]MBK9720415.1 30S ribosomal protein S20 [Saprospiraceae bacterium]MBK9727385.1 30S ribosomal protein S20 [Saprospiraceae bacterium]